MTTADDGIAGPRLERLPTLPVFFKLAGRRALVAGGDPPTAWKTELLAATGAQVDVVASRPSPALQRVIRTHDDGSVRLIERDWVDRDLVGAVIAVGDMASDDEAARFRQAAHSAGVPVNVIDKPAFCDFQFGTVVSRAPLVLAITTDGAAPVLGQALRTRLEALLPQELRAWAVAAKAWRPRIEERAWDFRRRRRFWDAFATRALQPGAATPDEATFRACMDDVALDRATGPVEVTMVGCGAGHPDDLTFSAARVLQDADLVLYDPDVAPETVALSRREAIKLLAATDEALQSKELASDSRKVAWLGTGDPTTCPHWARRRNMLETASALITVERGLQVCPRCAGRCLGQFQG